MCAVTNDLSGLLQKGLFEEEANRNLDAAVQAYQSLVTAFDQDRKLAATAVFRLGECYRKLGKTNEAVLQYERIVHEFTDEATLATLSRQNLAGLGASNKASVSPNLTQAARQEQKRLFEQEMKLLEQDLAEVKKRFEMGAGPQADVRNKERELLQLKRQLAALDVAPTASASGSGFTERLQAIIPKSRSLEAEELERLERILVQARGLDDSQLRKLVSTSIPDADFEQYERQLAQAQSDLAEATSQEDKEKAARAADRAHAVLQQRAEELIVLLKKRVADLRDVVEKQQQVERLNNQSVSAKATSVVVDDEARQLASKLQSLERLKDEPEKQARAVLALFPDEDLKKMLLHLPKLQSQEARFKANPNFKPSGLTVAVGPGAELVELQTTDPSAAEAWAELKKQLTLISERANFILGLQRERLQVLQSIGGTAGAVTASPKAVVVDEEETEIRRLQAMIQNSPDLKNAPVGDEKLTPLYQAAGKGQLRVARFLLDNGAALEQRSNGSTPLHRAAWGGHRAMVELLLARGADVNARDPRQIYGSASGSTALHRATDKGFLAVAEALVAGKADLNARNDQQETPLHLAAAKGHVELVKYLISKGAEVDAKDSGGQTPLLIAASRSQSDTVKVLLTARADPDSKDSGGNTALSYAAGKGRLETVKALLEAKADPNGGEPGPLLSAVQAGSAPTVQALLEAGADANRSGQIMRALPNFAGMTKLQTLTPLALAVLDRKADAAALLLHHKADPNALGPDRYPVILNAVGNADILKALLKAGARPNVDDGQGRTPLSMAAAGGLADSVSILLAHDADKEARFDGRTPLLHAVNRQDQKSVEALLKAGADVNARTGNDNRTALHLAASKRDIEMMKLLLAHKADVNARDNHGLTPLDIANGKEAPQRNQVPAVPRFPPAPPPPGVASAGSTPAPAASAASLAELLRQHGAQEGSQLPEPAKSPEKP